MSESDFKAHRVKTWLTSLGWQALTSTLDSSLLPATLSSESPSSLSMSGHTQEIVKTVWLIHRNWRFLRGQGDLVWERQSAKAETLTSAYM